MTTLQFAEAIAAFLAERNQFIKLISWNHYEIEENSRPERLAEIQQVTYEAMHLFTICVEKTFPHLSKERAQGFMLDFFTYLYGIDCFVSLELVDDSKVDDSSIRNYEPPIVTNQIGYRTNSLKTAVFDGASEERTFDVVNADTGALAYEFYQEIDADFAKQCLDAGEKAWDFLAENPNLIFKNPTDIVTGEYGDNSDRDERYWAAAQMWRATGKEKYLIAVESIGVQSGMDSANLGDYGNIAILTMDGIDKDSDVYRKAKNAILRSADTYVADSVKNMFGFSVTQYYQGGWGSNMKACNQGILMGYAYQLTREQKYLNAANADLNYLFGCNPLGICYLMGYGTVSPEHPHHRPSIAQKQAMPGMLVSGVHPYLEDSAAKAYCSGQPTGKCYVDNQESYSTNEITIYWNSPLTYLLAFTESNMTERVKGDVNADGAFNLADVILMQHWLLAESDGTLVDWEAGDLYQDGILNVLDLCRMKQRLLS